MDFLNKVCSIIMDLSKWSDNCRTNKNVRSQGESISLFTFFKMTKEIRQTSEFVDSFRSSQQLFRVPFRCRMDPCKSWDWVEIILFLLVAS